MQPSPRKQKRCCCCLWGLTGDICPSQGLEGPHKVSGIDLYQERMLLQPLAIHSASKHLGDSSLPQQLPSFPALPIFIALL